VDEEFWRSSPEHGGKWMQPTHDISNLNRGTNTMNEFFFRSSSPEFFPNPIVGKVAQPITATQPGRVRHEGTSWPAALYQPDRPMMILPGNTVNIVGIQGITLLIVPIEP
jgi:hypothetical protein